ncbi:nuclear transport factor 2 family protein [Shewanella sp. OMA3-2]|uniref:nuclear transport factor 2 family protein n=1 Tax=Shewanella sp. OMA3-2 TaxID=2908650 RepID=UPI003FA7B68D
MSAKQLPAIIKHFIQLYQQLNKGNLQRLSEIYAANIKFQDPLHQVNGLKQLTEYFANLYENVSHIHFDITHTIVSDCQLQASLFWTMSYTHPKLNKGQIIKVDGMSLLKFNKIIFYHRDYFDAGEMLYQHVPILGGVIRMLNNRMG